MDQKQSEQWYKKLNRVINSAMCFSLAYVFFTYLGWFAMAFSARLCKYDSFVYYYGIKFILNNHQWNTLKVSFVYATIPLFSLFMAFVFLVLYRTFAKSQTIFNLFFLWGYVIGTAMFAAQGAIAVAGIYNYGSPYYQQLAVVFSWWKLPTFVAYIFALPFLVLFLYFAINYGKPFLSFSYSFSKINKLSRKRKYFFETAIVPFSIGALATTWLTFPMNVPVHAVYLAVIGAGLMLAWYFLAYVQIQKYELLRYRILQNPNIFFALTLATVGAIVLVTFRGVYISI